MGKDDITSISVITYHICTESIAAMCVGGGGGEGEDKEVSV